MNENLYELVKKYNHDKYVAFCRQEKFDTIDVFENILSARYMKVSRIRKKLVYLLTRKKYCWFCTFTFNDNYINKCDRTKRDLIKKSLFGLDCFYILNIDYGSQTEREHYHAIIGTDFDLNVHDYLKSSYPCFSSAKSIRKELNDMTRLSKYINKLSNHCVKSSTKNNRIIYNFKGYDIFKFNTRLFYLHDLFELEKGLPLLDKGNTSGK